MYIISFMEIRGIDSQVWIKNETVLKWMGYTFQPAPAGL